MDLLTLESTPTLTHTRGDFKGFFIKNAGFYCIIHITLPTCAGAYMCMRERLKYALPRFNVMVGHMPDDTSAHVHVIELKHNINL